MEVGERHEAQVEIPRAMPALRSAQETPSRLVVSRSVLDQTAG